MTNDMMNVRSLVEKSADAGLLREMIGFAAERLIELEIGGATGAGLFHPKQPPPSASAIPTKVACEHKRKRWPTFWKN